MNLVFYDKSKEVMEIVTDILSNWNVPYRIKENRQTGFFHCSVSYDIHVNIDYEFYLYLDKEINKEIANRVHLEDCYSKPCAKPAVNPELADIGKKAAEEFDKAIQNITDNISKKLDEKINEKKSKWMSMDPNNILKGFLDTLTPGIQFDKIQEISEDLVSENGIPEELLLTLMPELKGKKIKQVAKLTPNGIQVHIEVEHEDN